MSQGGGGCADCHHNGNKTTNGLIDDTFQDYNIHEPGVISESTVDGNGPFFRPNNDYFFTKFAPPQDVGTPQNFSSRNTKHLRAFWDSVPRWLHYGFAHTVREILLPPDSPLLQPGERGFNFRTVRTDQRRGQNNLPTEVPITPADTTGSLAGDGKGPLMVSLDSPTVRDVSGKPLIDQLGTSNVVPLVVANQINPVLAANNIQVIKDTHGRTSHLSASDFEALTIYLRSLEPITNGGSSSLTPFEVDRQRLAYDTRNGKTRAQLLSDVIDVAEFKREYNQAFVVMRYLGYFYCDPQPGGYDFWLNLLNNKVG